MLKSMASLQQIAYVKPLGTTNFQHDSPLYFFKDPNYLLHGEKIAFSVFNKDISAKQSTTCCREKQE